MQHHDRPVISAVVAAETVADVAGDTYLASLPTVDTLDELVDSSAVAVVSAWVAALVEP